MAKSRVWIWMVVLVLGAALAACGGQPATDTVPTNTEAAGNDITAEQATPTAESLDGAAGASAVGSPTFEVTISGDFSRQLSPASGNTIKLFYQDVGAQAYILQIGDEYGLPIILFTFSVDETPTAGEYPLVIPTPGMVPEDGGATASASLLSDETDANGMKLSYAFDQPTGTLKLEENNGVYSGSFDFTLKGKAFASNEYTKTITVKGTFSGVSAE